MRAFALAAIVWLLAGAGHSAAQEQGAARGGGEPTPASVRTLLDAGRYTEAEAQARSMVDRLSAGGTAGSLGAAEALDLLVEAARRTGKSGRPASSELAENAVVAWERLVGPDDLRITTSLINLALSRATRGDRAAAAPLYRRALAIRERVLGPNDPAVAQVLSYMGTFKREGGDFSAAQQDFERALAIREQTLGPEHEDVAHTLNDLAINRFEMGDFAEAQELFERAIPVFEKRLGPEHPVVAVAMGNLGAVLNLRGEYAAARHTLESALGKAEKTLGADHPKTISIVSELANVLAEGGEYVQAQRIYERSLASDEKRFGPEHPRVAVTLQNLGLLLADMGDQRGARAAFERCLAIREKALGPAHPKRAAVLQALANLLLDSDASAAEVDPLLTQALAIQEQALGPDHTSVALTLSAVAKLARKTGDYARARSALERACAILEKNLGPDHPQLGQLLLQLGQVLELSSAPEQARGLIERAVAISERNFGAVHPQVAASRAALATQLAHAGEAEAALQTALDAEAAARGHVRVTVRSLGERQALEYAAARSSGLDLAVDLLVARPQAPAAQRRDTFDSVVRSRALVLDELAARQRTVAMARDPEIEGLAREVARAGERLAHIVVRGPDEGPVDRYQTLLAEARRQKERAEETLAARSLPFREEQTRAAAGLDEVQAALPVGASLVAFVRYVQRRGIEPPKALGSGDVAYAAFVLRPGQVPDLVPLGSATELDAAVTAWRQALEYEVRAPGVAPKRSLKRYVDAATTLRREVWDPVAPLVTGSDTVFIVPDGPLHLVNFAALPTDAGRFLLETGPLLHVLSAERDLVARPRDAAGKGLLLMGAPQFASLPGHAAAHAFRGATANCASFRQLRFSPLPATKREVEAIEVLWRRHSHTRADSSPVLLLEGPDADEAAFKDKAPGRETLHLATHGFVLGNACAVPTGNALLCSGLALAGANRRQAATPTAEDGILTAEEIAALDLSGVEWAVLSACETGLGEIATGEGVFGLRRAFQVAGTRSVIMSLWPVDDRATRLWMERLYRHRLQDGMSTAAAVRTASLDVLRQRRARAESPHPLYWAGFLAAGDWR